MTKKVALMEFEQNPNVGLYIFVNDKFCVIGKEIDSKKRKEIENVLDVPIYTITCLGTDLVGVFICGNDDFLIIPQMHDYEIKEFEKVCKKHNTKLIVLSNKINTYGNSICVSDSEILINSKFSKEFAKKLSKLTKYKIHKFGTDSYEGAGSICVFLNEKYYVSQELNEDNLKPILKKIGGIGTVNSGSNFIASGIVGNSNGVILGSMCSTIEIQDIVENLNYLN